MIAPSVSRSFQDFRSASFGSFNCSNIDLSPFPTIIVWRVLLHSDTRLKLPLLALLVPRGSRRAPSRRVLEKVPGYRVLTGRALQPCPGLPVRLRHVPQSRSPRL